MQRESSTLEVFKITEFLKTGNIRLGGDQTYHKETVTRNPGSFG